jgi:hypothetical protein
MQRMQAPYPIARSAALIASVILLSATAACSTFEAALDRGAGDSPSAQNGGDVYDQVARDSQSGG